MPDIKQIIIPNSKNKSNVLDSFLNTNNIIDKGIAKSEYSSFSFNVFLDISKLRSNANVELADEIAITKGGKAFANTFLSFPFVMINVRMK